MLNFIREYYFIFGLIPVIFYLFFRKRLSDKGLRVIILLLIIGFFADIYSVYLANHRSPNFKIFNWFILVETLLLLHYFYKILPLKSHFKLFLSTAIIYTLLFLKDYYFINGNRNYLDNIAAIENVIVIILSIVYFFKQISNPNNLDFQKYPQFWVVCAYLIYFSGTLFLFLYINTLPKAEQQNDYVLNYIFLIPKSLLLSIAMCMKNTFPQRKKFQLT